MMQTFSSSSALSVLFTLYSILAFCPIANVLGAKKWEERGVTIEVTKAIPHDKCKKVFRRDTVHQIYSLSLEDGTFIHANKASEPFVFRLGLGEVVKGMDIGMAGMCEGEERKLSVPSELGYGKDGNPTFKIPGGANLKFEVTLAKIIPANRMWMDRGVEIEVTKEIPEDKCKAAKTGDTLHQFYTVKLEDGTLVDSNMNTDRAFIFQLNKGGVIKGMDIAMEGMCEGEKRNVIIPSHLGYGEEGRSGKIPGGATLYFNIELRKLIPVRAEL